MGSIYSGLRKGDGNIRLFGEYKVAINQFFENNQCAQYLPATPEKCTRLDLKPTYPQMKVELDSQPLVTINTKKGLFIYTMISSN